MATMEANSASHGYDSDGTRKLLNKINEDLINEAISVLNNQVPNCISVVDTVWKGKSADAFKKKLENDTEILIKKLGELEEQLNSNINKILKNINNADEDAVYLIK